MKKLLISGSIASLLLPGLTFAAFNDVTLGSSAKVTAAGQTLDVSGDSNVIETIGVEADFITFTIKSGSFLVLSSPTFKQIEWSATSTKYVTSSTCESNSSTVRFASSANEATITVFPKSTSCPQGSSTTGGSSGGGGGGGGGTPAPQASPVAQLVTNPNFSSLTPAEKQAMIAQIRAALIPLIQQLIALLNQQLQAMKASGAY